jgi:hypothetical protein
MNAVAVRRDIYRRRGIEVGVSHVTHEVAPQEQACDSSDVWSHVKQGEDPAKLLVIVASKITHAVALRKLSKQSYTNVSRHGAHD